MTTASSHFNRMHGKLRTSLLIALFSLALDSGPILGLTITERLPEYTLVVPDTFKEVPYPLAENPGFTHYLIKGEAADDELVYSVGIQKLGGVIGREPIKLEHIPSSLNNARVSTAHWQGFEVCVVEHTQSQQFEMLVLAVQVPLKSEAIQIVLGADPKREAEMRADLQKILDNLQGPSNWIPSALAEGKVSPTVYSTFVLAVLAAGVLFGLFLIYQIAQRKSYRTAAWTAIGLLVIGNLIRMQGIRVREVIGLQAILSFSGFAGLLMLGALHFMRSRGAKAAAELPARSEPSPPT